MASRSGAKGDNLRDVAGGWDKTPGERGFARAVRPGDDVDDAQMRNGNRQPFNIAHL